MTIKTFKARVERKQAIGGKAPRRKRCFQDDSGFQGHEGIEGGFIVRLQAMEVDLEAAALAAIGTDDADVHRSTPGNAFGATADIVCLKSM